MEQNLINAQNKLNQIENEKQQEIDNLKKEKHDIELEFQSNKKLFNTQSTEIEKLKKKQYDLNHLLDYSYFSNPDDFICKDRFTDKKIACDKNTLLNTCPIGHDSQNFPTIYILFFLITFIFLIFQLIRKMTRSTPPPKNERDLL